MALTLARDTRIMAAAGNPLYFYLRVPVGRLKTIQAVNLTTYYKRVILYVSLLANIPGDAVTSVYVTESEAIWSEGQGTYLDPVIWNGDIPLDKEHSVIMARFSNVEIGDILQLSALVEVE